jgi:Flp pilus assembly protein TadD
MQPRDPGLRYLLGSRLLEAGRERDARQQLRVAVALAPRDETIRDALERAR